MSRTPTDTNAATPDRLARMADDALAVADAWRVRGRWSDALTLLRGIAPVVRERDDLAVARQQVAVGRVLTDMATFGGFDTLAERKAVLAEAMRLAEQSADQEVIAAACAAQGMSLHIDFLDSGRTEELPDELPLFERALALRRAGDDQVALAESLFHVGLVYGVVREDHQRALPYFEQAYQLAQAAEDAIGASYAIRHIAFARADSGDIAAALPALEESLRLREAAGFVPGVAMAWMVMAYPYRALGETAKARHALERAREHFAALDAPRRIAEVDAELAALQ